MNLFKIAKNWMTDFEPYGSRKRKATSKDCVGCRNFHEIKDLDKGWGVCLGLISPRRGFLTFEQMGCEYREEKK